MKFCKCETYTMEQEILDIVGPLNLPIEEKLKRVKKTLSLVTMLWSKYDDYIGVAKAYEILYFETDEESDFNTVTENE